MSLILVQSDESSNANYSISTVKFCSDGTFCMGTAFSLFWVGRHWCSIVMTGLRMLCRVWPHQISPRLLERWALTGVAILASSLKHSLPSCTWTSSVVPSPLCPWARCVASSMKAAAFLTPTKPSLPVWLPSTAQSKQFGIWLVLWRQCRLILFIHQFNYCRDTAQWLTVNKPHLCCAAHCMHHILAINQRAKHAAVLGPSSVHP